MENQQLARIVRKCAEFSPKDRFSTVNEVKKALYEPEEQEKYPPLKVRLIALEAITFITQQEPLQSDIITITCNGTYKAFLNAKGYKCLSTLVIRQDGTNFKDVPNEFNNIERAHPVWTKARVVVDEVIINNVPVNNTVGCYLVYNNTDPHPHRNGYVGVHLWSAWYPSYRNLIGVPTVNLGENEDIICFTAPDGGAINTIEVTFTIHDMP